MTDTSRDARAPGGVETIAPASTVILYTNWRGETAVRQIFPWMRHGNPMIWFGTTEWHPEPQWFLSAVDIEKDARRDWALSGIKAWGQEAVDAALAQPDPDGGVGDVRVAEIKSLREMIKRHGGVFHGPRVEHLSMEEQAFWRFMEEVLQIAAAPRPGDAVGARTDGGDREPLPADAGAGIFPRGAGTGTYFRRLPNGTWNYLNHADQWQGCATPKWGAEPPVAPPAAGGTRP